VRIALLTYSTRPRGGVVHTLALAEALAAAGQDVTVVTLGRGGDQAFFRAVDPAVHLQVVPFPDREGEDVTGRVLRSIALLAGGLDPTAFDVVHAQDCISANAAGRPVRTVHHLDTFTTPALVRCHARAITEPVAHVCVSAAVAAELATGWGVDATVIPNGVDASRFAAAAGPDPAAAAARRAWRAAIGRPYLLSVGGIEPRKGTIDLLEAYARLRDHHPDLALVIAGGETLFDYRDYRARFDRRAGQLGVAPVMLGPVEHARLPALVAGAAVLAMASTKEGFGLAAMEALAAGVPVVLRDLPVLREVFDGAAWFGVGPAGLAGAVRAALAGDDRRRAAGRDLAARHTWTAAAARHLELYERLIQR
jgi:glycosyltransferase-like protein